MKKTLLQQIERHLRRTGEPASRVGRLAINDPRLVDDMRNGREPRRRTVERVVAYLQGEIGA